MLGFRDERIAAEVNRCCIMPCGRQPGDHDACLTIVKDDDDACIVRARDGGLHKLTYHSMSDLTWVHAEPVRSRKERVELGLADPPAKRKLTPAMVTVATTLRVNGINNVRDLRRYAEERGLTIPAVLRQLAPGDADQALEDMDARKTPRTAASASTARRIAPAAGSSPARGPRPATTRAPSARSGRARTRPPGS